MKNKIRCLFEKINKFIKSEHFFDDVLPLITLAVVIFSTVFCMLLSTFSVSAAAVFPYTFTISNPSQLAFSDIFTNYMTNTAWEVSHGVGTFTADTFLHAVDPLQAIVLDNRIDFVGEQMPIMMNNGLPNGTYNVILYCGVESDGGILLAPNGYDIETSDGAASYDDNGRMFAFVPYSDELTYNYQLYDYTSMVGQFDTIITVLLIPADYQYDPDSPDDPITCPTLEEQISNYNGTWTEFLMMLRQNNRTLANSYQNNIDLAIQSGFQSGANSVTLEQRLSEFDGDWQDFERLMAEYNVDLQTMYTYYVNSLETQAFEDGKDYGQDIGYKNGYNSGLNKGQSDTFTKNFFTDFLGGVVEAIDSIHLYEHIREIDGGVLTVVEWYISPWTIFTSMICLIVVIIILKVWLGG